MHNTDLGKMVYAMQGIGKSREVTQNRNTNYLGRSKRQAGNAERTESLVPGCCGVWKKFPI